MIGRPSHMLLSIVEGEAAEKSLGLEWGEHRRPFSVGKAGDWTVCAPGVADVHLYLAFRGSRLCVAPASADTRVRSGGVRLPETWSELPLPAELHFGQARIRARAALSSRETLAATREVDVKQLAPLLDASRPRAGRVPTVLLQTALAAPASELLETMCDGGALGRQAARLRAEAQAGAKTQRPELAPTALAAPDPDAFTSRLSWATAARSAAILRGLASALPCLLQRCRNYGSRGWHQLRALQPLLPARAHVPALRRAALASLAAVLLVALAVLQREPVTTAPLDASTPASEATNAPTTAPAASGASEPPSPLDTTAPGASEPAEPAPGVARASALAAAEENDELPQPSPQLQREAFRAALGGDSAAAAALYQELARGPEARVYQLAARYAAQGRVRRP